MIKIRKSKEQKAITLIALIVTIVVLLILAVVAISSIKNNGIISKTQNTAKRFNGTQENMQVLLNELKEDTIAGTGDSSSEEGGSNPGGSAPAPEDPGEDTPPATLKVDDIKNVRQTTNRTVYDEYGNKIVVPAGFKIRVDKGERTKGDAKSTATHVTQGIVIEDASGNQFVWVPVGNIKESTTDTIGKTITLGRYSWSESTGTLKQPTASNLYTSNVAISGNYDFTEYQSTSSTGNAKARNINDFYESVMGTATKEGNGGYYIGRFEAGVTGYDETATTNNTKASGITEWTKYVKANGSDPTLVCKANQKVWDYITQKKASELSKNMYNEGRDGYKSGTFSSDLINSYAWDTAIVFIQTFGIGEDSSTYANENKSTSFTTTGGNQDEYCNINDMSGNAMEWSTETSSEAYEPCVHRGGYFLPEHSKTYLLTRGRGFVGTTGNDSLLSFRPLLYVGL